MKIELRWAQEAADDLENIADFLFQNTPERAEELVRQIYDAPHTLLTFPHRGRAGRKEGTRELVLSCPARLFPAPNVASDNPGMPRFARSRPRLGKVVDEVRLHGSTRFRGAVSGFENNFGDIIPNNAIILAALSIVPRRT